MIEQPTTGSGLPGPDGQRPGLGLEAVGLGSHGQAARAGGQPEDPHHALGRARVGRGIAGLETDFPVSERFMADAISNDMPVIVFTVNAPDDLRYLLKLRVSGIETDDPALLVELMRGE